jgi:hypothetical protein
MKNYVVLFIFLVPGIIFAQTNINIDISDIKFERHRNPTGFCLSYLSDLQFSSQSSFEQAIIESKVGSLRFPMGTLGENYLWQTPGSYNSDILQHRVASQLVAPGNLPDVNADGTFKDYVMDFDQFIAICQATNTEPVVMVNAQAYKMNGSIVNYEQLLTSAVEWVKYANVKKGYNVKYWEIGNEIDLHNGKYMTKEEYKDLLIDFSIAMKAVDPTIKVGAGIFNRESWMNYIVDQAADHFDFLVPHQYTSGIANYGAYRSSNNLGLISNIEEAINAINRPGGTTSQRLEVIVTEYSAHSPNKSYDSDDNAHYKGLITFEMLANIITLDKRITQTHFWVSHSPWEDRTTISEHDAFTNDNQMTSMGYAQRIIGQLIKPKILNVTKNQGYLRNYAAYDEANKSMVLWVLNKNNISEDVALNLVGNYSASQVKKWEFTAPSPNSSVSSWNYIDTKTYTDKYNASLKPYSITAFEYSNVRTSDLTDKISDVNGPNSISPGGTYNVTFDYQASTDRDIYIYFERDSPPYAAGYTNKIKRDVSAGSGSLTVPVTLNPGEPPIADNEYKWQVHMSPNNAGPAWSEQIAYGLEENIDCVEDTPNTGIITAGTYYLKNKNSGRRMRPSGPGQQVAVEQGGANGTSDNYKWEITQAEPGYYFITNVSTGLEIRIDECGTDDFTMVETLNGTGNCVRWQFAEAEPGYYFLTPKDAIVKGVPEVKIRNKDCGQNEGDDLEAFNGTGDCVRWALENAGGNTGGGSTTLAINSGGGMFTGADGTAYLADNYASGGNTYSTTDNISGTADDVLYRSERFGNFSYNIPVDNGSYDVQLKFAEVYFTASNKRVFDVRMEGNLVINDLDIHAKVGHDARYDETHTIDVTDGVLNIQLIGVKNNAKICAIDVKPSGNNALRTSVIKKDNFEQKLSDRIKVYPNPISTNASLFIQLADHMSPPSVLEVTDITGRIVYVKFISDKSRTIEINTLNLHSGLYNLRLIGSELIDNLRFVIK